MPIDRDLHKMSKNSEIYHLMSTKPEEFLIENIEIK